MEEHERVNDAEVPGDIRGSGLGGVKLGKKKKGQVDGDTDRTAMGHLSRQSGQQGQEREWAAYFKMGELGE